MKVNVLGIVSAHFRTLRSYRTGKRTFSDSVIFIVAPFLLGGCAAGARVSFGPDTLNGLLSAFSIFAGLLLNLLVLILGFSGTPKYLGLDQASAERRGFLSEVNDNLAYSILLSILVVVACITVLSMENAATDTNLHQLTKHPAVTLLMTVLVSNFVLTMLLVLKRVHAVLSDDFKRPSLKKSA